MTPNREKQRERVIEYFLDATKSLILNEGIVALTTKKIGDRAGFSYATIYNYFPNFNALVCEAVEAINNDVAVKITQELSKKETDTEPTKAALTQRIIVFTELMLDHMAENTNVYYPFISTEINFDYFKERDGHPFVHPCYIILSKEIEIFRTKLGLSEADAKNLSDILSYVFHAKLHFFIHYRVPETRAVLEDELRKELAFILR